MLKFRFTLIFLETGEKTNFKTLKEIAKKIDIPYHQARSILLSEDKLYLHPKIEELTKQYKIEKTI
jgi:hypothetical protein